MPRRKKISQIVEGLDDVKKKQILTEVRSVRIQSIIAILTVIGSAIAFVVIQQNNIKGLFQKDPKISFVTEEEFVKQNGLVLITDVKGEVKAQSNIKNLENSIELSPGSYIAQIKIDTQKLWQQSFVLDKNENRKIVLPKFYAGSIRVFVNNNTPEVSPDSKVDVDISASGNGYLWIYELRSDNQMHLLFPTVATKDQNQITAERSFDFPGDLSLTSGLERKEEKYFFLVLSINEEGYAEEIINLLHPSKNTISKGEIKKLEKNWGVAEITVKVR